MDRWDWRNLPFGPKVRGFQFDDMEILKAHFPDGVQIMQVDHTAVTETVVNDFNPDPFSMDYPMEMPVPKEIQIELHEIEPETGIWAGMSPFSHNVYIFIEPWVANDKVV